MPIKHEWPTAILVNLEGLACESRFGVVRPDESGYVPLHVPSTVTEEHLASLVAEVNGTRKATPAERAAALAASMFGWDTPAADPARYDADGRLI